MKPSPRIVFFGTPDFASYTLEHLIKEGRNIVGVVTTPDRPAGRGHKLRPSAVKEVAEKLLPQVPLLQPEKLRDETFLRALEDLKADLFVVIAFRMLPAEVWSMPPFGTFNLHASLLPRYRGAAPIQHVILNGEKETGVTTFFIDEDIDTGRVLLQKRVPITDRETGGTLHDKLMQIGATLVSETIDLIAKAPEGKLLGQSQVKLHPDPYSLPQAPKIFKEDRLLSFTKEDANAIDRRVRAMSPYPVAIAQMVVDQAIPIEVKIFESTVVEAIHGLLPGDCAITDGGESLTIQCLSGAIQIKELQMPSKRPTPIHAYLQGNPLDPAHTHFL